MRPFWVRELGSAVATAGLDHRVLATQDFEAGAESDDQKRCAPSIGTGMLRDRRVPAESRDGHLQAAEDQHEAEAKQRNEATLREAAFVAVEEDEQRSTRDGAGCTENQRQREGHGGSFHGNVPLPLYHICIKCQVSYGVQKNTRRCHFCFSKWQFMLQYMEEVP